MSLSATLKVLENSRTFRKAYQRRKSNLESDAPFYRKWIEPTLQLSPGAILIHQKLELLICPPLKIHKEYSFSYLPTILLKLNPCYNKFTNTIIRITLLSSIFVFFLFSIGRLFWINSHWRKRRNMEELFLYMVLVCMITIGLSGWLTLHRFKVNFAFGISERFKCAPLKAKPETCRQTLGDLFMYGFGIGCAAFPLMVVFIPVTMEYEPLSVTFHHLTGIVVGNLPIVSKIFTKLSFGFIYVILTAYGAGMFLSLMNISILFMEGLQQLTNEKLFCKSNSSSSIRFSEALKMHRIAQLLFGIANPVMEDFLFLLVGMGVVFAGWCAYATLMMYQDLPLLTYLACPVVVAVALVIDFVFVGFANIPNRNSEIFKQYWREVLKRKADRKQLESCPLVGYNCGRVIRNVTLSTALIIAHGIVNCTVNLVLLKQVTNSTV